MLLLQDTWNVSTAEQAIATINWLLKTGDRPAVDPMLQNYHSGNTAAIDTEIQRALSSNIKDMAGVKVRGEKITDSQLSALGSGLAWDIERAAFVARLAFNASYISEQDTWSTLQLCSTLAHAAYESWTDYLISYILGRSVIMSTASTSNSYKIFYKSALLIDDGSSLWNKYPRP
jgi:hypothetical protein